MRPYGLLSWALRMAAAILRTPFIDFNVRAVDETIAEALAEAIRDGRLTDEELAAFLEALADSLEGRR